MLGATDKKTHEWDVVSWGPGSAGPNLGADLQKLEGGPGKSKEPGTVQ